MRVGDGGQPGTTTSTGITFDDRTTAGVALTEDAAAGTTVADGNHQLRVRRGVVRATQRDLHVS